MECWWAHPSSHDGSVHVHSHTRSVSGTQVMAAGWNFADLQNQLDGIVRNKAQPEGSYCAGSFLYT